MCRGTGYKDPNLLLSRQKLLELARTKVNKGGYIFKKGKSRSKQMNDCPAPKRPKTSASVREKHIGELQEDIKDLRDRLQFKEKRRDQASMLRKYKVCDQLSEEISAVKKQLRDHKKELQLWMRKQQQATWYKKKGSTSSLPSSDSEDGQGMRAAVQVKPRHSLSSTPVPATPPSSRSTTPCRSVGSSTPVSPIMNVTSPLPENFTPTSPPLLSPFVATNTNLSSPQVSHETSQSHSDPVD